MKKILSVIGVILAIGIGLYPAIYFIIDPTFGLLGTKSADLLANQLWHFSFYTHIVLGGLALLIGWAQFWTSFRKKYLSYHRLIGRIYILAVLPSAITGIYIGCHATGGMVAKVGFVCLGIIWLVVSLRAYLAVKKGKIQTHQIFMIYSYAATFAAVTLRLYMPLLIALTGDFIPAYQMVAWLCWVPNLIVAYFITKRMTKQVVS